MSTRIINRNSFFSHVEEIEEPFRGVELEQSFSVEGGLAKGQESADGRPARQQHFGAKAARDATHEQEGGTAAEKTSCCHETSLSFRQKNKIK